MAVTLDTIKIGISACLLGHPVRYNGGHKQSRLCKDVLARHFEFIPLCPEQAIGLATPREPIRLVGDPANPQALGSINRTIDVTDALTSFGTQTAEQLDDICGYILMQKSPSCGMQRVKVYQDDGQPADGGGRGLFAAALMRARPDLPVEEDGRLNDAVLRENFITRVFAYAEWQRLQRAGLTRRGLITFHERYKYQLMATCREQYRQLGREVAQSASIPLEAFAPRYFSQLMAALKQPANRGSHTNVLQHLSGYLKRALSSPEKQELQRLIEQYRTGVVPLVVPITMIKHHFRRHPHSYIDRQAYLQPHPDDLSLRNAL
ncbi:MAG: 2-thiouracil desulfurase family protein [Pseudomonas profundi]|uniref:YbgA family protein n=1 Tax=Pseudomonas profundi TaxID=1981513 RepID=UPI003001834B